MIAMLPIRRARSQQKKGTIWRKIEAIGLQKNRRRAAKAAVRAKKWLHEKRWGKLLFILKKQNPQIIDRFKRLEEQKAEIDRKAAKGELGREEYEQGLISYRNHLRFTVETLLPPKEEAAKILNFLRLKRVAGKSKKKSEDEIFFEGIFNDSKKLIETVEARITEIDNILNEAD